VLARVFEPFFTTKEKGKGTGLGLATVYGIVHQGGGHVLPYSELGHGTVFKIYLPRAARPRKKPSSGSAKKLGKGRKETVLVCEDDRAVSLLARRVLEDNGFAVRVATSGEEAVETAKGDGGPIDLVVTDTVLPGMTGLQLIAALRSRSPGLRAVLMSGYTEGALEVDGPLPEGVVFLQKPFAPAALFKKVRQALGRDT
jgi:two-component system cell cycle sensor histidine kinase/response regulator CckA